MPNALLAAVSSTLSSENLACLEVNATLSAERRLSPYPGPFLRNIAGFCDHLQAIEDIALASFGLRELGLVQAAFPER